MKDDYLEPNSKRTKETLYVPYCSYCDYEYEAETDIDDCLDTCPVCDNYCDSEMVS